MEVGHWLCNEDSLLQAWVGTYDKTWTSDIWLLLIFCEGTVAWTIFSQLERLMRRSHTRQPGVAEDIERWCGLSSSPVVVLSVDEHPVVTHSSSVMVTHAFEVGKTSSCRKTAAANGSWRIKQLCSKSFYIWRQKSRYWWSIVIASAWHNESKVL